MYNHSKLKKKMLVKKYKNVQYVKLIYLNVNIKVLKIIYPFFNSQTIHTKATRPYFPIQKHPDVRFNIATLYLWREILLQSWGSFKRLGIKDIVFFC